MTFRTVTSMWSAVNDLDGAYGTLPAMKGKWFVAAALVALLVAFFITRGPEPPTPNPPGSFSFAALGDAPYYVWEDLQYKLVLQSIDEHDLLCVVHVGDLFWKPCSVERYRKSLRWFNALRHPVFYTPGDNEWLDCWEAASGGYVPLERLDRVREIFFADPARSLGGSPVPVACQADDAAWPEFVENVRWTRDGIVFATFHLIERPGNPELIPGRGPVDEAAARHRIEAAAAWLTETFLEAGRSDASAVVLGFHANLNFDKPVDNPFRKQFDPFLIVLEDEVRRFGKPVLAAHGDWHEYIIDKPLVHRTTGERLQNFTRLQVPGSPVVGWVRVIVTPGLTEPFAFELHAVPDWKYW